MNTNNDRQLEQKNSDLHKTYLGLAQLLHATKTDYEIFHKTLRHYYIIAVHKHSKTIIRTALICGVDRKKVAAIIKGQEQKCRTTPLIKVIDKVEKLAINNKMIINKIGKNSLQKIMLSTTNGAATLNSIIEELIDLECVKDMGDKIKFIKHPFKKKHNLKLKKLSKDLYDRIKKYTS